MGYRFLETSSRSYGNISARLNERITLHISTDSGSFSDWGEAVKTTADIQVWAKVIQTVGFERRLDGFQDRETKVYNIWIRYRDDVRADDKITYRGQELTISDVAMVGIKHALKIRAQLGQV